MDDGVLKHRLATDGWVVAEGILPAAMLAALRDDLQSAYATQREIQVRNGVGESTDGTVHHLPLMGGSFLEFLDAAPCHGVLDGFFNGPYILNTFGGVLNLPRNVAYVGNVHRDIRTFCGSLNLMAQLLVMLDDFTEENGATYFLNGSHTRADRPDDQEFFAKAARAVGPAGSIVMFNSNLWHAAGVNKTTGPRRGLTLAFTKPFLKQQLDYPRAVGYARHDELSERLRQVLGYNARIPASLDEWYQPPEKRLYKRDQG